MGERLRRLDPRKPSTSITVALATFHTVLFVLVALSLVYLFGDLGRELDNLNALAGLGLFAYLWVIVWVTTAGALRRMGWPATTGFEATTDAALRWGAVTGAAILLVAAFVVLVAATVYGVVTLDGIALLSVAIAVPFALIGGAFAFAIGAFFGALFGIVDYALLKASEAVLDAASPAPSHADL